MAIRFGTDGWRAIIGEDFTFANVRVCAEALARDLSQTGAAAAGVVVGYDTRFGSDRFASATAEVLAAHNVHVWLCERAAPTPAVSHAVVRLSAGGGVVITASHNPAAWNGFKVKTAMGSSSPPEHVARLEERIAAVLKEGAEVSRLPLHAARQAGTVETFDPTGPYLEQLGRLVDRERLRSANLLVVADAMHGAGGGLVPRLFAGSRVRVVELNGRANPAFPGMDQPEPVAANLRRLMSTVPEVGAPVGLALDGDADRLGVVDENGRYLTTLEVFSL
ncbi:MAG: phosphoglucomutase/phosphomannomutase family protein, partial [Gemmatimonadetes bacterium]|nr:phosphoglucomutase/phosphomannomutase family protein [Gemmatimonadota bacterium]